MSPCYESNMPCTSLWLVSTANPLEMAKEGYVIWYLDFSCSRIGLQLTSPWILKNWLNSWRVVLEFFYMIQKFITLTTEREAIIFKEYQLSKILLSDPLLNHTRFKANMLRCYLKSIYMLDCIRIAVLGINIWLGFIIVRS